MRWAASQGPLKNLLFEARSHGYRFHILSYSDLRYRLMVFILFSYVYYCIISFMRSESHLNKHCWNCSFTHMTSSFFFFGRDWSRVNDVSFDLQAPVPFQIQWQLGTSGLRRSSRHIQSSLSCQVKWLAPLAGADIRWGRGRYQASSRLGPRSISKPKFRYKSFDGLINSCYLKRTKHIKKKVI